MLLIYSPALRCVQFMYYHGRKQDIPIDILKDYHCTYQTDGYEPYASVAKVNHKAHQSHCNAHARRYFDKALTNDKARASAAMLMYQKLYLVEAACWAHREKYKHHILEAYHAYRLVKQSKTMPILATYK